MTKIRGAIYAAEQVDNKDRRFGSNQRYLPAMLIQAGRKPRGLMLSNDQIQEAGERWDANPEDQLPFEPEEDRIAAAVEEAVIEALRNTPVDWKGEGDWLLPIVAVIAMLSGAAVTAAVLL